MVEINLFWKSFFSCCFFILSSLTFFSLDVVKNLHFKLDDFEVLLRWFVLVCLSSKRIIYVSYYILSTHTHSFSLTSSLFYLVVPTVLFYFSNVLMLNSLSLSHSLTFFVFFFFLLLLVVWSSSNDDRVEMINFSK